ncbi:hypothetical protein KDL01_15735 [Actinospica durhamensis]|uniref:Uncharacterized protein n=1 Tax=Actinospica durhamensis TaxID=1508375 RepID=A0A941EPD3_9ACTN|nr:hypothetical protein [Actinospica durhamensis]MBR7834726.1 hypothetical protein [Actinospica durhamensis]
MNPLRAAAATTAAGVLVLLCVGGCSSAHQAYGAQPAPATPTVVATGVAYEYYLYVHCEIRYAYFDGRWWEADHPLPTPSAAHGYPEAYGTMTLVTAEHARFAGQDLPTVDFHPLSGRPPGCS